MLQSETGMAGSVAVRLQAGPLALIPGRGLIFKRVRKIVKSDYYLRHVRPSAWWEASIKMGSRMFHALKNAKRILTNTTIVYYMLPGRCLVNGEMFTPSVLS